MTTATRNKLLADTEAMKNEMRIFWREKYVPLLLNAVPPPKKTATRAKKATAST